MVLVIWLISCGLVWAACVIMTYRTLYVYEMICEQLGLKSGANLQNCSLEWKAWMSIFELTWEDRPFCADDKCSTKTIVEGANLCFTWVCPVTFSSPKRQTTALHGLGCGSQSPGSPCWVSFCIVTSGQLWRHASSTSFFEKTRLLLLAYHLAR